MSIKNEGKKSKRKSSKSLKFTEAGLRTGRLSKDEWVKIEQMVENGFNYIEIARTLNRTEEPVKKFIEEKLGRTSYIDVASEVAAAFDIRNTAIWAELMEQFTTQELKKFSRLWEDLVNQFIEDDILSTEYMQIVDIIKLDILIDRLLIAEKKNIDAIYGLEQDIKRESEKEDQDKNLIQQIKQTLAMQQAAREATVRQYKEMIDRKDKLLRGVRGSREQRVKDIDSRKKSFTEWLKELALNKDLRLKLGREIEKHRLATENEYHRLGAYYEFADGTVDRPVLNSKTIKWDEENGE